MFLDGGHGTFTPIVFTIYRRYEFGNEKILSAIERTFIE